jgi:hypothetical protein
VERIRLIVRKLTDHDPEATPRSSEPGKRRTVAIRDNHANVPAFPRCASATSAISSALFFLCPLAAQEPLTASPVILHFRTAALGRDVLLRDLGPVSVPRKFTLPPGAGGTGLAAHDSHPVTTATSAVCAR